MLTAGHCIYDASKSIAWHNGAGNVTWGVASNYDFAGYGQIINNDMGLFGLGASAPSVWNQYYAGSPVLTSITGEVPATGLPVGMILCRYGWKSAWDCGSVTRTNFIITLGDGTRYWDVYEIRMLSQHGDSGAGFVNHTIYGTDDAAGILSGGETRSGTGYTYFFPLFWEISGPLGFWPIHACVTSSCP